MAMRTYDWLTMRLLKHRAFSSVNEVFVNKNFEFQNELERHSLQRQEIGWIHGFHGLARILELREEGYPQIALILTDLNERPETRIRFFNHGDMGVTGKRQDYKERKLTNNAHSL
jgi:hypothetical protein